MAYATKYLFKWESSNGTTREIQVQKDGYSGSVIQRRLGRAPVLKKQRNGTVFGTSLEFYAECAVDGEFAEFYTSDPKAYKVLLYTGATLLWQGYVTPELYSEPDIAPPYDVQVIATDGIGELKLYDFAAQGVKTLRQMFTYLLGYTGLSTDVYLISSMKAGSSGAGALLDKTINLDYKVGDTCYEVLTYLLDTLHATITWWRGAWIVARETNVTFSSNKVRYYNTSGNSALLTGSVVTLGKMYSNDAWPVGQLTQKIDPAKKSVTIQAPWHVNDALTNGDMTTDTGWSKWLSSFVTAAGAYHLTRNSADSDSWAGCPYISQEVFTGQIRVPMKFVCKLSSIPSDYSGLTNLKASKVAIRVEFLDAEGYGPAHTNEFSLVKDAQGNPTWENLTSADAGRKYDFNQVVSSVGETEDLAEELSLEIPPFTNGGVFHSGTLHIYICGFASYVYQAHLDIEITKGYQDRLHIDNGARGEEGTVEIAIGRETSAIDYYKAFMQGLLLDSGSLITSFKDDNLTTATDFLSYISRDYARSFALPRIVRTGKVYLEDGVSYPPLVLSKGAVDYWLETFSWDMYEDELDISARSLPTATITVESEVIAEYGTGTASSSSSSGGGATPITPIPSVLPNPYALTFGNKSYDGSEPVTLTASDIGALTGITAAMVNAAYGFTISGTAGSTYNLGNLHTHSNKSVLDGITSALITNWNTAYTNNHTHSNKSLLDSMTINWDNYFGIDSDGNVYVKKDGDNPRHFYSYGAVSAGGLSTGGGTSGIDLAAMWASLQNNDNVDTYDNYQFAAAHLPTCGSGLSYTISNGIATGINVSFPVTSVAGKTGAVTLAFSDITGTASTSQIPDLSGTYLPLTGGTLSGKLLVNPNAVTYSNPLGSQIETLAYNSSIVWPIAGKNYYHVADASGVGVGIRLGLGYLTEDTKWGGIAAVAESAWETNVGLAFYTTSSSTAREVLRIEGSGYVGILKNNPGCELDVNGSIDAITVYENGTALTNKYLALAGGFMTGWITHTAEKGDYYMIERKGPGGGGWAYYPILLVDSGNNAFFSIGAFGDNANLDYAFIGCNAYDGLNLRIDASSIKWGTNALWHAGNLTPSDYLSRSGGSMNNTNLVTNLNADLLDGLDGSDFVRYYGIWQDGTPTCGIGYLYEIYGGWTSGPILSAGTASSYFQIQGSWDNDTIKVRTRIGNTSSMSTWKTIWTSGNSNRSDATWECSTLTTAGKVFINPGSVSYPNPLGSQFETITSNSGIDWSIAAKNYYHDSSAIGAGVGLRLGLGWTTEDTKWGGIAAVSESAWESRVGLAFYVSVYPNSYEAMRLDAGGNLGIGTSSPSTKLDVRGVIHASTGILSDGYITAGSASSREFKDNVRNMSLEFARNIIMSSRPITFQWNALAYSLCDKYEGDGIGFIAQEAEQLMPFAVSPIFEKYKRLDYTAYVSPLVCVAQNHETRIQQLERESREKDAKIAELKQTIARLTN